MSCIQRSHIAVITVITLHTSQCHCNVIVLALWTHLKPTCDVERFVFPCSDCLQITKLPCSTTVRVEEKLQEKRT